MMISLSPVAFRRAVAIGLGLVCALGSLAPYAEEQSLSAAQKRLTYALDDLQRATTAVKRSETQLKDAEDALARYERQVQAQKAKVEQARNQLSDAKAREQQAQQKHDEAFAEIQRFYREQQPTSPAKPPTN